MKASVGFLTFEQFRSQTDLGSSRIRAHWLINHWPEAELFQMGSEYKAIIFQKVYWPQYLACYKGVKILDICDPDFLDWRSDCLTAAQACDVVTTSTEFLASALRQYISHPVIYVPDRIDITLLMSAPAAPPLRAKLRTAGWFGYSGNFNALDATIEDLVSNGIEELTVISEAKSQYKLPKHLKGRLLLRQFAWAFDDLRNHLQNTDIVINYTLMYGHLRYKSNNKSLLAWALGLPVAHSREELRSLRSQSARLEQIFNKRAVITERYDVTQSIEQYRNILSSFGLSDR